MFNMLTSWVARYCQPCISILGIIAVMFSASPAFSKNGQNFFMLGGVGNTVVDPNTLDILSESTSMYHIGIGIPLSDNFAAEYNRMMEISTDHHLPNMNSFSIDTTVDSFSVVAKAPISEQLMDTEALVGLSFSDVSYSSSVINVKDFWLVPGLNLGVQHRITKGFSLRFERYLVKSEIQISGNRLSMLYEF